MSPKLRTPFDQLPARPADVSPAWLQVRTAYGVIALFFPAAVWFYYCVVWWLKQPLIVDCASPPSPLHQSDFNLRVSVLLETVAIVLALWSAWRMLACQPERREWMGLAAAVALFALAITLFS